MGELEDFQRETKEFIKKVESSGYTVGLELEFLYTPEVFPKNPGDYQRVWNEIAKALEPVAANYPTKRGDVKPQVMVFSKEGYTPWGHTKDVREKFVISEDATIIPSDCGKEVRIEVSTPVMENGSWIDVIPMMMKHLGDTSRVSFNNSTGLHIHLGVGVGKSFSLPQSKKIAEAIIIFERQLDTLHPTRGTFRNRGREDTFYKCVSENKALRGLDTKQKIELISAVEDEGSAEENYPPEAGLLRLINPDGDGGWEKNYAYHFGSIEAYGTIEFRQAIGTLDARWTLDWTRRIISLVEKAIHTTDGEFLRWAENGINDEEVYQSFGVPAPET